MLVFDVVAMLTTCSITNCSTGQKMCIYRVFQNLCHKLFLGIPHPKINKKVPINMGPKMNRFQDIDLRSCAGTLLSIT